MTLRRILASLSIFFFVAEVIEPTAAFVRAPYAPPPAHLQLTSDIQELPAIKTTAITECTTVGEAIPCRFHDLADLLSQVDYVVRSVTAQSDHLPPFFIPIPPRSSPVDEDSFTA